MKRFTAFIAILFPITAPLFGTSIPSHQVPSSAQQVVTAGDYYLFLNNSAATDSQDLWNEKMGSDPTRGSIVRTGTPGQYEYFVIAGCQNQPVYWVNRLNKEVYCNWISSTASIADDEKTSDLDLSFASNVNLFNVNEPGAGRLSLALTDSFSATISNHPYISVAVALIMARAFLWEDAESNQEKPYETAEFREYNEKKITESIQRGQENRAPASAPEKSLLKGHNKTINSAPDISHDYSENIVHAVPIETDENPFDPIYDPRSLNLNPPSSDYEARMRTRRQSTLDSLRTKMSKDDFAYNNELSKEIKKMKKEASIMMINGKNVLIEFLDDQRNRHKKGSDFFQFFVYEIFQEMEKISNNKDVTDDEKRENANYRAQNIDLRCSLLKARMNYHAEKDPIYQWQKDLRDEDYRSVQEYVLGEIERRKSFLTEMQVRQQALHDQLYFRQEEKIHKQIDEEIWNILYEDQKNNEVVVKCLNRRLENRITSAEIEERLKELEHSGTPINHQEEEKIASSDNHLLASNKLPSDKKNRLLNAYRTLQHDLKENPLMGITNIDFLRYAWNRQKSFSWTDEYNIAPNLTFVMGWPLHGVALVLLYHYRNQLLSGTKDVIYKVGSIAITGIEDVIYGIEIIFNGIDKMLSAIDSCINAVMN